MKYLIVGTTALLSDRNFNPVEGESITISTLGIPATAIGATVNLLKNGGEQKDYALTNGKVTIPLTDLDTSARYAVTFAWQEADPNTGIRETRAAYGNPFHFHKANNTLGILPAYSYTTGDVDMLWNGMVQLMENLIPFIEQYKYGNDAV